MDRLPQEAELLEKLSRTFTRPTGRRFLFLVVAAIVAMGRRTVSRLLWSANCLIEGDPSSYHRFFSQARWSMWPLARIIAAAVLAWVPTDQPVVVDADDTVAEHRGKHVYGVGCHRDAVRSSWTHTVFKWGHKWVVLAVNVRLPGCRRSWALPVMAALYTPPPKAPTQGKKKSKSGNPSKPAGVKRHKTPALLARQMLATLIHWIPDRKFILPGDWGFASHDLALFCHRHSKHVTLIARIRSDTNLYCFPPTQGRKSPGRKRSKGNKLPGPRQTVARTDH